MEYIEKILGKDLCGIIKDYLQILIIVHKKSRKASIWLQDDEFKLLSYLDSINSECIQKEDGEFERHNMFRVDDTIGDDLYYKTYHRLFNRTKKYYVDIDYHKATSKNYNTHPDILNFVKNYNTSYKIKVIPFNMKITGQHTDEIDQIFITECGSHFERIRYEN